MDGSENTEEKKKERRSSNAGGCGSGSDGDQKAVRTLESPKFGLSLGPVEKFLTQNSPTGSPAGVGPRAIINVDTES
jgi:hypothetical protein